MRRGYVTVFFSIVIMICFSILLLLIYGARENAIRMKIDDSSGVSMKSVFAEYQREIWNRYDLLFIDAGYGYSSDSLVLPEEHFIRFLNENLSEYPFSWEGGRDLLKLNCSTVETNRIRFATDNKGQAIRVQAIEIMKERYGLDIIESLYGSVEDILNLNLLDSSYVSQLDSITENYEDDCPPIIEEWIKEANEAIFEEKEIGLLSTLRSVFGDISSVSVKALNESVLVENRLLNTGNYGETYEDSMANNLLFKEYLMTYCNSYLSGNQNALAYEVEYLICGDSFDAKNLEKIVNRLLLIREAANISTLYSDEDKIEELRIFCEAVTTLMGAPEAAEALVFLIVSLWSYIESICDVRILLDGEKVPLIKTKEQWKTTMADIFTHNTSREGYENGLSYKDYLRGFLFIVDVDILSVRFMNILEANIRKDTENESFRLDMCFDAWEINAYISSEYGYDYIKKTTYEY